MKIYKKCTTEKFFFFFFLVNDMTLPSDNPLRFRKNLLEKTFLKWIYNKIMMIDDQIKDEKLQYDINREATKISALSSGKIDKYEYLTGEEILPFNQKQIIEQDKFTYSLLGKALEKQTKKIEDQQKKQVDALKSLESSDKQLPSIKDFISKERLNLEIMNEIERIEEKKADRSKMVYKGYNNMILENLKQYVFLVIFEIILLVWV